MVCEYCREEVNTGALICQNCKKKTSDGRDAGRRKTLMWVGIVIGVPIILLIALVKCGQSLPQKDPADQIKEACERQYGRDNYQSRDCQIALSVKKLEDINARKLDEAGKDAGVRP